MSEVITLSRAEFDKLVSGLRILAAIPVDHIENRGDDHPIMGVDDTIIRVGHVREARRVLETIEAPPHSPAMNAGHSSNEKNSETR